MNRLMQKKLFLLDMDGTLYKGCELFAGSREFLRWLRINGRDYRFLTNNSSKSRIAYIEKLKKMGIQAGGTDFVTSAMAAAEYLRRHHEKRKIYVFGTRSLLSELAAYGLDVTDTLTPETDCLLLGSDTELTFRKLEDACRLLQNDIPYLATNPDWTYPTEYGSVPDCGCLIHNLGKATGKTPVILGKPRPEMITQALAQSGCKAADALIIGDRIHTDICCGINAGVDTALVLSGETTKEEADWSDIKPDWIFRDIGELWANLQGRQEGHCGGVS